MSESENNANAQIVESLNAEFGGTWEFKDDAYVGTFSPFSGGMLGALCETYGLKVGLEESGRETVIRVPSGEYSHLFERAKNLRSQLNTTVTVEQMLETPKYRPKIFASKLRDIPKPGADNKSLG